MAAKGKTWVWIVVGIAAVGVLALIAMAAAGFYFVSRHVESTPASAAVAAKSFDEIKAKFADQKPLIELDDDGDFARSHLDREAPANPPQPQALHVLVFNPEEGRLFRLTVPWWLLRLQSDRGTIKFDSGDMKFQELKITPRDLERFGPALIVSHQSTTGERVLVWSQ